MMSPLGKIILGVIVILILIAAPRAAANFVQDLFEGLRDFVSAFNR